MLIKLLKDRPSALSVGRLVLDGGFAYTWLPGQWPKLWLPSGGFIRLNVRRYVPMLPNDTMLQALAGVDAGDGGDTIRSGVIF